MIAKSNTDGFNRVLEQLERQERTSYDQHKGIEDKQRLQNCLSAYDFASRQRLRKRAEDGELNLASWCS